MGSSGVLAAPNIVRSGRCRLLFGRFRGGGGGGGGGKNALGSSRSISFLYNSLENGERYSSRLENSRSLESFPITGVTVESPNK